MILVFDTETTGFVKPLDRPISEQPYLVELGMLLCEEDGTEVDSFECLIKPDGWTISDRLVEVHGITTERAMAEGIPLTEAIDKWYEFCSKAKVLVAHNVDFDNVVMYAACHRARNIPEGDCVPHSASIMQHACTMKSATDIVRIPKAKGSGFKWPKLIETHLHAFNEGFSDAHTAMADMKACKRVYFWLKEQGAFDGIS